MKYFLFAATAILCFHSCGSSEQKEDLVLADFYHLAEVDSIIVNNNSGTHRLNAEKQNRFIEELRPATIDNGSYKLGAKSFSIYIHGNEIYFSGATHSDYLETHSEDFTRNQDMVKKGWVYFKTEGFNIDNY